MIRQPHSSQPEPSPAAVSAVAPVASRQGPARPGRRPPGPLRVAVVAGGLSRGGAEKQIVCVVRALREVGSEVRVYSLTRDGTYREPLRSLGADPVWIGKASSPIARLVELTRRLRPFAPDVIQAGHSFVNLYVGLAGSLLRTISLGALRSSLRHCEKANGFWTRWLMTVPTALVTNSESARRELLQTGWLRDERVFVLPNAIDLSDYPYGARSSVAPVPDRSIVTAIVVGRIIRSKRVDIFLRALALARQAGASIRGLVVGEGPDLSVLRQLAIELNLCPEGVLFLGERGDVAARLGQADMLVLCSEDEGFPNVILEAMAAGLPVISTPAGDAPRIVQPDKNGALVPFGDAETLATELVRLARSPQRRVEMGSSGRDLVARRYDLAHLVVQLRDIYGAVALLEGRSETLDAVSATSA